MNEEQLMFLFENYASDKGFADYDEFKGLMSDENARKVFFENSNPDLGFTDYDEFNNVLGVSGVEGKPVNFTEGSGEQQEQPTEPLEKPIVDVDRFDVPETDEYLSGAREAATKKLRETEELLISADIPDLPKHVIDYPSYNVEQLDSALTDIGKREKQTNFILSTRGLTQPQRTEAKKQIERLEEERAAAIVYKAEKTNDYSLVGDAVQAVKDVGYSSAIGKKLRPEVYKLESRVSEDIFKEIEGVDIYDLTEIDFNGIRRADVDKVADLADKVAESIADGNPGVRQIAYERILNEAEEYERTKKIKEKIESDTETQDIFSKYRNEALSEFESTNDDGIKYRAELVSTVDSINNNAQSRLNKLVLDYNSDVDLYKQELISQVQQGIITNKEANKKLKDYNIQLYSELESSNNLVIENNKKDIEEVSKEYYKKIEGGFNQFLLDNPMDPSDVEKLQASMKKIYEEVDEGEFAYLKAKESLQSLRFGGATSLVTSLGKSYYAELGRAISSKGTFFNQPWMTELGDEMMTSFSVADERVEDWSDLANVPAVVKSVGRLAGSATTSIVVGAITSTATAGLGTIPAMAAVATASGVTESIDMAGNIKRDIIRETGSLLKGEQGAEAMWKAQMGNWWTYLFDGLPYVGKALRGVSSKAAKIGIVGLESSATETVQETRQTAQEQKIMESVRSGEEISARGFGELITPGLVKSTFLEVAPGSFFLGGSTRAVTEFMMDEKADKLAKEIIVKTRAGLVDNTDSFIRQKIFASMNQFGKNFTNSWLATLQKNGAITEEELGKLYTYSKTAEGFLRNVEGLNLTEEQMNTYFALSNRANELYDKAESITDDKVTRATLTEQANALKKNAQDFLNNPETGGSFVSVKIGKSPAIIMNEEQAIEFVTNNPYVVLPESEVDIVARNADEFGGILEQMVEGVEAGIADLKSIDDYGKQQSEEGRLSDVDNTLTKINNAEYINDSEIDAGIEQIFDEVDRVDGLDISDNAKESIKQQLFGIAETLDNYEFRTKTETRKVTPEQPVEGRAETKREIPKKSTSKAEIPGVGTVNLTFTGRNTISITPKGQEGTTARVTTFTFPENFLYTNEQGDFTALVIEDAEGNQITINDPEIGVPLAINNIIAETAAVPTEVVEEFVTEEINYIKERKEAAPEAKEAAPVEEVAPTTEPVETTTTTEGVETTTELTEEQVSELNKLLGLDKSKRKAKRKGRTKKDNQRLDKVERAVDLLEQSLSEVMPNIVISVAEDSDMFARFAGEQEEKKEDRSKGLFTRVDGTYVIVLNPDSADVTTVFHEGLHAVLVAAGLPSTMARAVTARMVEAVKKTATKKLQRELEAFTELYETPLQSEEYIAELIGILANNYNEQNNETKSVIRRWLQKLAEMLGLKPKGVSLSTVGLNNTDAATIDALNFVAKKMSEGGVLTEQDLTRLTQPGEQQQGDGGEETVTRKQKAPDGSLKQESPLFKSTAKEGVSKIQQKAATPEQWVKMIADKGGKGTTQELEWIGLQDYLNEWKKENKVKSVPKEVVEQYINDNQIEIVEVTKTNKNKAYDDALNKRNDLFEKLGEARKAVRDNAKLFSDGKITSEQYSEIVELEEKARVEFEKSDRALYDFNKSFKTKYSSYALEGGENYREVLLTLPNKKPISLPEKGKMINQNSDEFSVILDVDGHNKAEYFNDDYAIGYKDDGTFTALTNPNRSYEYTNFPTREEALNHIKKALDKTGKQEGYQSSHWDESNILAHLRINERTLPNGERVMFIEEVQSDWAQEGKKKGFKSKNKQPKLDGETVSVNGEKVGVIRKVTNPISGWLAENSETGQTATYTSKEKALKSFKKDGFKTPDMPYKKTDQWVGMAMRRAMQMAAQEGFDRIAWVTGEQSAERYDLSEEIDDLIYDKSSKRLSAYKDTEGMLPSRKVFDKKAEESELESIVGKEVAQKIIDTTPEYGTEVRLRTQDLKVGGEGMKAFYNSILPKVAKKEAQRFDKNAKVEVVDFKNLTKEQIDANYKLVLEYNLAVTEKNNAQEELGLDKPTEQQRNKINKAADKVDRLKKTLPDGVELGRDGFATYEVSGNNAQKQLSIAITPEMRMKLNSAVPLFKQKKKKPKSKVKDAFEWGIQKGIPAIAIKNHLIKLGYTEEEITSGAYDAEKIWNKDGKKVVKWLDYGRRAALSARKFRPQTMFLANEAMESSISAELRQAKMMAEKLNRAINKYKSQDKRDELIDAVDEFMRDAEERDFWRNELPDDIAQIAEAMRVHIDSLSLKLVDSGVIKAESSRENILGNIGVYMNRSYQVFDNKNWKEEVSEQVITAAQNHLREAYYNSLSGISELDQQLKDGKITESEYNRRKNRILSNKASVKEIMDRDNVSEDEALTMHVDDVINSILTKKDVNDYILFAQPKVGKKDLSSLKRRKDIPPAIRALMGEYTDPGYNYAMSIFKIANLVENQKYLTKIRDAGLGVWLFEKEAGKKIPEGYEKITFKDDASMNPLDGLYAPKEVKEAFNDTELNRIFSGTPKVGKYYNWYLKSVGAVKYSKTILSYGTHAKNVIGNMYFMAQNGYLDPREYQQPFIALVKQFSGKELTAEQEAKMDEWVRAGIIGQGATIGEIKSFFEGEDSFEKALTKRIDEKTDNMLSKAKKGVKKFGEKAQEAYQYEDDMFKIVAYEKEKLNYSKILFDGKSYNQLDASQQSTVNDYVAEIIKNILPNYGRIGGAGKFLKAFPVAGTFISFQIEAYRTAYNTVALAIQEIKGDIPGISETGKKLVQKRGVMRLMSIVGFQAFKYGLISLLGIPLIPGDDDDEDGLSEKIRTLLPFWDTNSDISVQEVKPNGNFTYVSISASDPYGSIFKVVNATKNFTKTREGFSEIFGELTKPFISEDILFNTLMNIKNNENDYGGKIVRNTDTPFEASAKIALQLYKTFVPGGITSTRKIIQSENKLNEALGQFTGFKLHEVKSLEQAGFKFGDIQKKAQESKSAYNSIKYNMDDYETQEDINKVIRASKKSMDEDYQEAVKLYQALISLGVSDRDVKKKMYDYGISGPMRSQIARNSVDVKLNPIKK